jgi:CDP-diacylglycerol--glycerol-3-phosphate 3-phosphatidyltransferase
MIERDQTVAILILISLVTGGLIPYIRAKAESMAIECSGGFAERTERIVLSLTAIGFYGLGVDFALIVGFGLLSAAGLFTVLQRMVIVYRALHKV